MFRLRISLSLAITAAMFSAASAQQVITYKCTSCGGYHTKVVSNAASGTSTSAATALPRVVAKPAVPSVQDANATAGTVTSPVAVQSSSATVAGQAATTAVYETPAVVRQRWNFHNANRWRRQIDPRAQAWAQEEANRLARRAYSGYLQNGHPGGNNPHASVTGTGTTFPGATLIHTCEGSNGMTLVAEAAAVSHDGRIYGVRSWR